MILIRLSLLLVAVLVAVVVLKLAFVIALFGAIGFCSLFAYNVTRRAFARTVRREPVTGTPPMRRVMPLARPKVTVPR